MSSFSSSSSSFAASCRKFSLKHPVIVDVGCSCRSRRRFRRRPRFRLSTILSRLKQYSPSIPGKLMTPFSLSSSAAATGSSNTSSSSTSYDEYYSSCDLACPGNVEQKEKRKKGQRRWAAVEEISVAVEKESTEPYADFRESLAQMIVEEELYTWDDLNGLLHRLLSLNSPAHHHLILAAFADICDAVFQPHPLQ